MNWFKNRHIRSSFFHQIDSQDCGIASLISVMRYFKIYPEYSVLSELVQPREWGATMLDLKRSALQSGCDAQAFEMSLSSLKELKTPVILHTVDAKGLNHFIVYYLYDRFKKTYLVGDPAAGIQEMDSSELNERWKSKAGLVLKPNGNSQPAQTYGKWTWLLSLVHHEKFLLVIITFLGLLTAFLGLSLAIYLQTLTDKILPTGNYTYMVTGLTLLAGLFIVRSLIVNYRQRVIIAMVNDFNKHLVQAFSAHLLKLPASFLRSKTTGDMVVRFNDTQTIQVAFSTAVSLILIDVVMLIAVTGFLFSYSILVAASIVVFISLTVAMAFYNASELKRHQRQLISDFSRTDNLLILTLNALKQMDPTDTRPDLEKSGFYDFIGSTEKFSTTVRRLSLKLDLMGSVFFAAILCYTSFLVMDHTYSKGEFLAMVTLIAGIFPVVQRICTTAMVLMDGVIALERVYTMVAASTAASSSDLTDTNQTNYKPAYYEKN